MGDDYAWWLYNAWAVDEKYAHVVGQKLANGSGLHDMSGNVWEWCEDDWHDGYGGAPVNGDAWFSVPRDALRVLRGGSWGNPGDSCRSARRFADAPSSLHYGLGFRLAR